MTIRALAFVVVVTATLGTPAHAAPPVNDDRANAMPVTALPFFDIQDFAEATSEPGEPGCNGSQLIDGGPGSSPTVWYRYAPATTAAVVARTARMFGAYGFVVYREDPSGLTTVGCGRSAADQNGGYDNDVNLAMFIATAGEIYLVQVVGPDPALTGNPTATSFRLEVAPEFDVVLDQVTVEPATPTEGLVAWNRWVSFRAVLADPPYGGGTVAWRAYSCPRGSALGCSRLAEGEFYLWQMSQGDRSFLWRDVGCIGDVEIRVDLETSYEIDPRPENNSRSTTIQVLAPDPDAGLCP